MTTNNDEARTVRVEGNDLGVRPFLEVVAARLRAPGAWVPGVSPGDADDIRQEVFLSVAQRARDGRLGEIGNLTAFLKTALRNKAATHRRRQATNTVEFLDPVALALQSITPSPAEDGDSFLEDDPDEMVDRLRRVLRTRGPRGEELAGIVDGRLAKKRTVVLSAELGMSPATLKRRQRELREVCKRFRPPAT